MKNGMNSEILGDTYRHISFLLHRDIYIHGIAWLIRSISRKRESVFEAIWRKRGGGITNTREDLLKRTKQKYKSSILIKILAGYKEEKSLNNLLICFRIWNCAQWVRAESSHLNV